MRDRQLLLAEQYYAGKKEMLRRVGVLAVIDASKSFTITAVGNAVARLDKLICRDATTNINYDIIAGQLPKAAPGDAIYVWVGLTNIGTIVAPLFIKVTDIDTGTVLYNQTMILKPNEYNEGSWFAGSMPAKDWRILVEVGH